MLKQQIRRQSIHWRWMYFYMNHPFEFYFLFCIPQIRPAVSSAFSDVRNERSTDDTGTCVWYGICPDDRMKYCLTNQTAPKLDSEAQALLSVYCPELVHDADNTFTCCDIDQVRWWDFPSDCFQASGANNHIRSRWWTWGIRGFLVQSLGWTNPESFGSNEPSPEQNSRWFIWFTICRLVSLYKFTMRHLCK